MGEFILKQSSNKVWYGIFTGFAEAGIKHGVSTRLGGCSNPPFASLNLGLHVNDDPNAVWHNRQLFCKAVGLSADKAVTAEQIHGDAVKLVTAADAGCGSQYYDTAIKGTDALVTNTPGLPLMLFFADCVPVLIADPVSRAIGISHAGWKGTVAKIAQKTILAMQQHFNTKPGDCLVGIGPAIGPCCYEVDEAVINKLKTGFSRWEDLVDPRQGRWLLNLWEANREQLKEIGVMDNNITVSQVCTAENSQIFFSHRTENGQTGRFGAIISL
ncbi:MAG: Polyphenol oxidase [Firmicutes bacterium]|nr:Polyphenol oxidase [Bacillota bacterium]